MGPFFPEDRVPSFSSLPKGCWEPKEGEFALLRPGTFNMLFELIPMDQEAGKCPA